MARGWESKSVESQIDAAEERQAQRRTAALRADQMQQQTEREGLELSRERVLRDLSETEHPRRREQLQAALAHLESKLQEFNKA